MTAPPRTARLQLGHGNAPRRSHFSNYRFRVKGRDVTLKNNPNKETYMALWDGLVSFGLGEYGDGFYVKLTDWASKVLMGGNQVNIAQFLQLTGKNTFYYPGRFGVKIRNPNHPNVQILQNTYNQVLRCVKSTKVTPPLLPGSTTGAAATGPWCAATTTTVGAPCCGRRWLLTRTAT